MSAREGFEEITKLLEQALEPDIDPRDLRQLLIGAHTHTILQASFTRRAEAKALFAAFPEIENRPQ
jgi:hypothetical protein